MLSGLVPDFWEVSKLRLDEATTAQCSPAEMEAILLPTLEVFSTYISVGRYLVFRWLLKLLGLANWNLRTLMLSTYLPPRYFVGR